MGNEMKLTKHNVIVGLIIIVIIISAIFVIGFFTRARTKGIDYQELLKAKDETIKVYQEERDMLLKERTKDSIELSDHYKKDSILEVQSKQIQIKYEKIPVYINSLDREGLRAEVYKY